VVADPDVLGLEIPVEQTHEVTQGGRVQRAGDLGAEEDLGEGVAADDGHGVVPLPVGELAQVVERQDAGVLQLGGDLRLLHEARQDVRPVTQVGVQALDSATVRPSSRSRARTTSPMPPSPSAPSKA